MEPQELYQEARRFCASVGNVGGHVADKEHSPNPDYHIGNGLADMPAAPGQIRPGWKVLKREFLQSTAGTDNRGNWRTSVTERLTVESPDGVRFVFPW